MEGSRFAGMTSGAVGHGRDKQRERNSTAGKDDGREGNVRLQFLPEASRSGGRCVVYGVGHEVVGDVEVGNGSVQRKQARTERCAQRAVVAGVVDSSAERVVDLELQSVAVALGERYGQAVVDRTPTRRILVVLQNGGVGFSSRLSGFRFIGRPYKGVHRDR